LQSPDHNDVAATDQGGDERPGLWQRWHNWPLYLRIIGAVLLGVVIGLVLGERAAVLQVLSKLVLRILGALAPPLVLLAIVQALMRAEIGGRKAGRLAGLLVLNTLVAISIGVLVANVIRPGKWVKVDKPVQTEKAESVVDPLTQFLENVPKSIFGPLSDNGSVLSVIFLAIAFGVALRRLRHHQINTMDDLVHVALSSLVIILGWIVDIIPLAVFGIVASIIGVSGFGDFIALGGFVVAVLVALALQATYYLLRIKFGSWVRPTDLLRGTRDALVMAFSTSSSTATMPVTYACLRNNVGLREESASMGALVGANFNNDGTALYEAMSALFIAQLIGADLSLGQQFVVVITSVIASVGAAGIPEAGLVTMTLVFRAVGLPIEYIAMLLTVDWFLDRSRTAINVMGDLNVSCLLDGKTPAAAPTDPAVAVP
jgi:Na+/H+-dicarboxylate symporter